MSLLFRPERRDISYSDLWGRDADRDVVGSSIESALKLYPVFAATSLICDLIGTLPVRAFRERPDGTRERLSAQPQLITDPGPPGVRRIAWLHQGLASVLLRGNAVGVVLDTDGVGTPKTIQWQHPDNVLIDETQLSPRYFVRGVEVPSWAVVHVPGFVLPGSCVGLSPLTMLRLTVESGLSAQRFGVNWYRNGGVPTGKLRNTAKKVSPAEAKVVRDLFRESVADGDLFVTGADWDYEQLTVSPADAQFLMQLKEAATQVAAVYRVPAEDIGGESGSSLTYSTLEQNDLRLARRAMLPWTERFEEALSALLPRPQYVKFNLDAASRADLMTRINAHAVALDKGLETNDEARALEERPPLTPEQITQWQTLYGKRAGTPQETSTP